MKVSILTACCDDKRFIKECSDSILSQDYPNLEWIVVDDCSSDGTYEWLQTIKDPRLHLVRNDKKRYCSSTYAAALKLATGDVCCVVDGDDAIVGGAVKKIVSLYRKYPKIDYIYTQHHWCNIKLQKIRKGISSMPKKGMSFAEMAVKKKVHCFSHWRTFKTKLRSAVLFPDGLKYSVDKNLGFVLQSIAVGGFYPQPLYKYRYYKGNMSLVHGRDQKSTWMSLANKYMGRPSCALLRISDKGE